MAKVAAEIKSRLLADGTWKDFTSFRDNAQLSGMTPTEATRQAILKYCPDLKDVKMPSHKKGDMAAVKEAVVHPSMSVASPVPKMLLVSPETFAGKSCAKAKAMDWVIEQMAYDPTMVRAETAPSAVAWSVYLMCQKSPVFASDLFTKYLVKNSKDELDTGDGEAFDGAHEYDVAAKMLEAQEVAGA